MEYKNRMKFSCVLFFLKVIYFILFSFGFTFGQSNDYRLNQGENSLECVKNEIHSIDSILRSKLPIRTINNLDYKKLAAQKLILMDSNFVKHVPNFDFNVLNRCEIFSITMANAGEVAEFTDSNSLSFDIYKVEMFNFGENITTVGFVNVLKMKVVKVLHLRNFQTEIPERLKTLAVDIALGSKIVSDALGYTPKTKDAVMAGTKTSLRKSKCERSRHLCVAPTFIKDTKALWVIVDLTDLRVVGIEWTPVGDNKGKEIIPTERSIQNKSIYDCYCLKNNTYNDSLWEFTYNITNTDGLKLTNVRYSNEIVISDVKLVDWKVSYSPTKEFGYSDAIGCPYYSASVVVAVSHPKIEQIIKDGKHFGVRILQEFQSESWPAPCNYNYAQKYEFYNDGSFRVACASLGRGCGVDGTYRPVYRIHMSNEYINFSQYSSQGNWKEWMKEGYNLQTEISEMEDNKYLYRLTNNKKSGFLIEPSMGQFDDGGRGDNAWMYITKYHDDIDEGNFDLPTLSSCCNSNYEQGPEKFINEEPESIQGSSIVLWYVPQILNDNRPGREYCWAETQYLHGVKQTKVYPCWAGPKFVRINK